MLRRGVVEHEVDAEAHALSPEGSRECLQVLHRAEPRVGGPLRGGPQAARRQVSHERRGDGARSVDHLERLEQVETGELQSGGERLALELAERVRGPGAQVGEQAGEGRGRAVGRRGVDRISGTGRIVGAASAGPIGL